MKGFVKHLSLFLAAVFLCAAVFSGCSLKLTVDDENDGEASEQSTIEEVNENTSTRKARVSIIQYSDCTYLNECCEGIKQSLDSENIAYEVTVGSRNKEQDDCEQKARDLAINSACDLVIVIGTQCAEAACPIISSAGGIPVVFCAVTDPVGLGICENYNMPGSNCTGVATSYDIANQLNMINTFQPTITRLGVIYTETEQNTKEQLKKLKTAADNLHITVFDEPVEDPSQLASTAKELMTKVEAVMLLPDNMIAMNSWNITNQSIVGKIPLYGVTVQQINEGSLAGYCYDFKSIGSKAGQQALAVLHGESVSTMPVIMERDCLLYVNKDRLKDLDMEIPDEYKSSAKTVSTSYEN